MEERAKIDLDRVNTLIRNIALGSSAALAELYTLLYGRLFHIALGVLCTKELAQEAVQEAFICLMGKANYFWRAENGYGFVATIVKRKALNILKRERLRRSENLDDMQLALPETESREDCMDVHNALKALQQDERRIIYLKYYADFTVRKIAALTKLSKSAVQRTIERAEKKMKEFLNGGKSL